MRNFELGLKVEMRNFDLGLTLEMRNPLPKFDTENAKIDQFDLNLRFSLLRVTQI